MDDKKFAILIDGDNTSSKDIDTIINEVAKEGVITYKRLYGDFSKPELKAWRDVALRYSITPMQQFAYTTGKNATDSAMIIDAMDILYSGKVDGFCLASSDSDFTRLAERLREEGMLVMGMGKQHTPEPFVKACSTFKFVDLIAERKVKAEQPATAAQEPADSAKTPLKVIKKSIDTLIEENGNDDGFILASSVGTYLQNMYNDFDPRNYGKRKTIELLKELGYNTKVSADKTTYFVSKPLQVVSPSPSKPKQSAKKTKKK